MAHDEPGADTRDPTVAFLDSDHRRSIFPLRTARVFAEADAAALRNYIEQKLLNPQQPEGFLSGQLAYSRKDVHHLRRVLVLDPLAERGLDNRWCSEHAI